MSLKGDMPPSGAEIPVPGIDVVLEVVSAVDEEEVIDVGASVVEVVVVDSCIVVVVVYSIIVVGFAVVVPYDAPLCGAPTVVVGCVLAVVVSSAGVGPEREKRYATITTLNRRMITPASFMPLESSGFFSSSGFRERRLMTTPSLEIVLIFYDIRILGALSVSFFRRFASQRV